MNYGKCPVCGGKGTSRERRPNGNDMCENAHVYPSKDAVIRDKVARVVCAANRNHMGLVVCSVRHFDPLMHRIIKPLLEQHTSCEFDEQGFVNTKGEFLTRTEAWKAAEENDQIRYRCGGDTADGGTLYSENLY